MKNKKSKRFTKASKRFTKASKRFTKASKRFTKKELVERGAGKYLDNLEWFFHTKQGEIFLEETFELITKVDELIKTIKSRNRD